MGLREQAQIDAGRILENALTGCGWPITLTDPAGTSVALTGLSGDIGEIIDPDTEIPFSGRAVVVSLRIQHITDAGLTLPEGIEDGLVKPWVAQFNDINGNPTTWKVMASMPDRTLGLVKLRLELYETL